VHSIWCGCEGGLVANSKAVDYTEVFAKNGFIPDEKSAALLKDIFTVKQVPKDHFFIREGESSTEIAMVVKGLFRSYYIDEEGNDFTKYFYPEGAMLFSYRAYIDHAQSAYSIQSLEESEIISARISDFERAVESSAGLRIFYKNFMDKILIIKEEHAVSFKLLDSTDRYRQFLSQYPGLESRIKQHHLASYLGITPVSLSRIRKKIGLNK